jgi:hypothetical protein
MTGSIRSLPESRPSLLHQTKAFGAIAAREPHRVVRTSQERRDLVECRKAASSEVPALAAAMPNYGERQRRRQPDHQRGGR